VPALLLLPEKCESFVCNAQFGATTQHQQRTMVSRRSSTPAMLSTSSSSSSSSSFQSTGLKRSMPSLNLKTMVDITEESSCNATFDRVAFPQDPKRQRSLRDLPSLPASYFVLRDHGSSKMERHQSPTSSLDQLREEHNAYLSQMQQRFPPRLHPASCAVEEAFQMISEDQFPSSFLDVMDFNGQDSEDGPRKPFSPPCLVAEASSSFQNMNNHFKHRTTVQEVTSSLARLSATKSVNSTTA
jgi:hypothetical protein